MSSSSGDEASSDDDSITPALSTSVAATDWKSHPTPSGKLEYSSASLDKTTSELPRGIKASSFDWSEELLSLLSEAVDRDKLCSIAVKWNIDKFVFLFHKEEPENLAKLIRGWTISERFQLFSHPWMSLDKLCTFMRRWDYNDTMEFMKQCDKEILSKVINEMYIKEERWHSDYVANLLECVSGDKIIYTLHLDDGGYEALEAAKILVHWSEDFIESTFARPEIDADWLTETLKERSQLISDSGWGRLLGDSESSELSNESMRNTFDSIDLDASGYLDEEEINLAVRKIRPEITDKQIEQMLISAKNFDKNSDGLVTFDEFKDLMHRMVEREKERQKIRSEMTWNKALAKFARLESLEDVKKVFESIDEDKSGDLNIKEVGKLFETLGYDMPVAQVMSMMKLVDDDNTGTMNFEEFKLCIECVAMKSDIEVKWK